MHNLVVMVMLRKETVKNNIGEEQDTYLKIDEANTKGNRQNYQAKASIDPDIQYKKKAGIVQYIQLLQNLLVKTYENS